MTVAPELWRHGDADALARSLSAWTQPLLAAALADQGQASLLVPGGRTPAPWFERLSAAVLPWNRVRVSLTDERWVDPATPGSNERLVREHLLRNRASEATLLGLKNSATTAAEGAAATWRSLAFLPRPFDLVVLGMGEDGHFASLFPGDPAAHAGLDAAQPPGCIAVTAPTEPRERISLNLAALLQARQLALLVTGERKLALLDEQQRGVGATLPIAALLRQRAAPLSIWWSP